MAAPCVPPGPQQSPWRVAAPAGLSFGSLHSHLEARNRWWLWHFLFIELAVESFISQYLLSQFSSVTQSCLILCDPMNRSKPGFPVHHQLPESTQTHVHRVTDAIQPSHPLSSPSPPTFNLSQHQGLSNESVLCIRWPKYWSFSFSISPSNEYSGLTSCRIDWFDLLVVQGTLESSSAPQFKSINSSVFSLLYGPTHIHTWLLETP